MLIGLVSDQHRTVAKNFFQKLAARIVPMVEWLTGGNKGAMAEFNILLTLKQTVFGRVRAYVSKTSAVLKVIQFSDFDPRSSGVR